MDGKQRGVGSTLPSHSIYARVKHPSGAGDARCSTIHRCACSRRGAWLQAVYEKFATVEGLRALPGPPGSTHTDVDTAKKK